MLLAVLAVLAEFGASASIRRPAIRYRARAHVHAADIPPDEFKTLNLGLDDAIAGAVTEFARQRDRTIAAEGTEKLGVLAHELRNLIASATLAFESIRSGRVAAAGSTGALLSRSLLGMTALIDRALAKVRLDAGIEHLQRISVAELLEELEIGAVVKAQARGLGFSMSAPARAVTVEGDKQTLAAALANLLHNAFKFSRTGGHISLSTRSRDGRILIDVADACGGLPAGGSDEMFRPYAQRGSDRSGVGLGLTICRRAAEANHGELSVLTSPAPAASSRSRCRRRSGSAAAACRHRQAGRSTSRRDAETANLGSFRGCAGGPPRRRVTCGCPKTWQRPRGRSSPWRATSARRSRRRPRRRWRSAS